MAGLDLVDWPADRTLALAGAPGTLRLPLTLRHAPGGAAPLAEASFVDMRPAGGGEPIRIAAAPVQLRHAGDGASRAQVRLRLDPATPPGRYEGRLKLDELSRSVTIDVLPDPQVEVRPTPLLVDVAAGREQTVRASFENRGNVPLVIDLAGSYPLALETPVAAGRLQAAEPLGTIVDRLVGRAPGPTLVAFDGPLDLGMPEGAARLEPGVSRTLAIALKAPPGLVPTARYHAFAPVYGRDLHIVIVTAAKPRPVAGSAKPKGAAA